MMRIAWRLDPQQKGLVCAALEGSLDPDGAKRLREQLLPRLGPETPKLLLDLTQVDWIGSAGVGAFMHLLARVQAHRGSFALFGCAPQVRSVLQVCGLEAILQVSVDEAEARQCLGSDASA